MEVRDFIHRRRYGHHGSMFLCEQSTGDCVFFNLTDDADEVTCPACIKCMAKRVEKVLAPSWSLEDWGKVMVEAREGIEKSLNTPVKRRR